MLRVGTFLCVDTIKTDVIVYKEALRGCSHLVLIAILSGPITSGQL